MKNWKVAYINSKGEKDYLNGNYCKSEAEAIANEMSYENNADYEAVEC